jgi:hypothetical protein
MLPRSGVPAPRGGGFMGRLPTPDEFMAAPPEPEAEAEQPQIDFVEPVVPVTVHLGEDNQQ